MDLSHRLIGHISRPHEWRLRFVGCAGLMVFSVYLLSTLLHRRGV